MASYIEGDYEVVVINESTDWFEDLRNQCLKDPSNWLRENYTLKRMDISAHDCFTVLFERASGECVAFSGLFNGGRYPEAVARVGNRGYVFPRFRSISNARGRRPWMFGCLIPMQIKLNPCKRELVFASIQERVRKGRVQRNWLAQNAPKGWVYTEQLIRTAPGQDGSCFQHIAYKSLGENYSLDDWNPESMSQQEWEQKFLSC